MDLDFSNSDQWNQLSSYQENKLCLQSTINFYTNPRRKTWKWVLFSRKENSLTDQHLFFAFLKYSSIKSLISLSSSHFHPKTNRSPLSFRFCLVWVFSFVHCLITKSRWMSTTIIHFQFSFCSFTKQFSLSIIFSFAYVSQTLVAGEPLVTFFLIRRLIVPVEYKTKIEILFRFRCQRHNAIEIRRFIVFFRSSNNFIPFFPMILDVRRFCENTGENVGVFCRLPKQISQRFFGLFLCSIFVFVFGKRTISYRISHTVSCFFHQQTKSLRCNPFPIEIVKMKNVVGQEWCVWALSRCHWFIINTQTATDGNGQQFSNEISTMTLTMSNRFRFDTIKTL